MLVVRSVSSLTSTDFGSVAVSDGSSARMLSAVAIILAPGWRCTFSTIAGSRLAAQPAVFCALFNRGDVAQPHRRAVAVADDQLAVILRGGHLVIG